MNNKGQALVEFVLILPLFIFLVFAVIDFGNVINNKNVLESDSLDIVTLFNSDTSIEKINAIYPQYDITVTNDEDFYCLKIEKNVRMITPGANKIFGNPYKIKVVRYIPYEQ